ncbi:PAS domain-containing protein [Nostoc sp. FACHB-110]|uniref:PAS domain-containing protein n=1 Tax=Nostoc sp. FACHB-110 TaxID=2692834 RepID=UPI0016896EF2|nr:PAS domain-containing protein [Nostoc sp. FACHB-110]MBD2439140.1 PAS domain-containing protein [Nostoc sp. FACHB-110]
MKRDTTGKFVNNWDSETKQRVSLSLTSTAWQRLDDEAHRRGISRSEVIEHLARGLGNAADEISANAENSQLQVQIMEQKKAIATLERQQQDLITLLENAPDAIALRRDMTDTQQQYTRLIVAQEAESRVATILENITDAFVAFDQDWRYTYVNQAAAKILQKSPAELLGKQVWLEVFPELVGKIAYQQLHRAVEQQVPVSWEELVEPVGCCLEVKAYPYASGVALYFRDITERKQADAEQERLLHELEIEHTRFMTVLQQLPTGVLIADAATGKLVLANEQAKQITGYDYEKSLELEEYAPITPFAAFSTDGRAYAPQDYPLARSLFQGEVISNEEMVLHQDDDQQTFISVNSAPIFNYQNQIVAAVCVFQDITERQQAQIARQQQAEALENQHKWLETVLDLMPTPMVFIEPETAKITFANRIANQLAGGDLPKHKSVDEYTDAYYCTDANGDRIPTARMPAVLIARGEKLENYEINWYTPGGIRSTLCWGEILPAMYGHPATGIGMFQDVTRLKQIEENLRQMEERLQLALSSAQMIAWDTDLMKNQVVCSPNALEVWGIQEGTGEDFLAIVHPEDQQQMIDLTQQAIATGTTYQQEYRIIAPNGALRWQYSQGRVYVDATGKAIRMIGVSVDITQRKQIAAERDRLLQQEQAARKLAETERKRLHDILMQMPVMISIVTGPNLVYEFANSMYLQLAGQQDIIGKSKREVFPELEGQKYLDFITQVYQTGETLIIDESPAYIDRNGDGIAEEVFFNCVFSPWRDIQERIQGVFIHAIEVTSQVQAKQQIAQLIENLQQKERQQRFLIELNDAIRAIPDSKDIMWQVVCATGQHFQVSRCTYGEIDATQEYVIIERDYCNGVMSIAGSHQMNSFSPEIIAQLKQGKTVVVDDVEIDPRTSGSRAAAFTAIEIKSLLCVPLVKQGQFVALLVLHHHAPRCWTREEVAMMERIAEKTWLAVERSRVEEALRESEAHLQLALKVGRMGTWDWDIQTGVLQWSEGHFTVLGLQPNQCQPSYEVWARRVHADDLAQVEAQLQQAMQENQEYHHEYRLRWLDGSIHWVEARGKFTYDAQGKPKHSIGAVIDITQRKQAEQEREKLLQRERSARNQAETAKRQLATIFNTSPIGMGLLDSQQRYIAMNEALIQINGLTREQHLGHSIAELFGESDPKLVKVFEEIYTTGKPFISPSFAVNIPGRSDRTPGYYNVYYLPTTNAQGRVEDVLVYVVDVTEQVELELAQNFLSEASAVLASSLDYQMTLERLAQLAVSKLADWCTVHIVEENGAIEQITVAHKDPAKLQWAEQTRHKYPLDPNAARGAAYTLRTGESDLLAEIPDELIVQAARDAEHLEILRAVGFKSVMTVPLKTQSRILGVITFVSAESGRRYDEDDLYLAEELAYRASLAIDNAQLYQLAQSDRAKAEAANRVKDEFLAVLSHELRSPLNPILGWTRMLRTQRLNPAKVDLALETIERNAKLQAQLIEDLLDVSRILQGKMTLNVAPVNLAETIAAAKETVRLAAEAKNIQIHTRLNPIAGTVSGDANRLQQIVWNLISNAVKFTPTGGSIEVRLEQVGMYAQIQVQDTGKGVSPKFLPYVFEYFRQEDGTTTRKFGGLGLGLAIVRHLTELHGGTVTAESPGQDLGATFTVRLPLNIQEKQGLDESDRLSTQHSTLSTLLTDIRILVVDDDADMRELAEFILMQSGAQVKTAASAIQALTMLNQSQFDLLLCDVGMPEMDGYSLIRQIRKWSPQQGGTIPAIALTAYAGEINQQQALQAGFQQHLAKPIDPQELVQSIAKLIANSRLSKSMQ